ncbi:MAG: hypothetical protein ACKOJB_04415, partial [Chthoniobacterales bacterium]
MNPWNGANASIPPGVVQGSGHWRQSLPRASDSATICACSLVNAGKRAKPSSMSAAVPRLGTALSTTLENDSEGSVFQDFSR